MDQSNDSAVLNIAEIGSFIAGGEPVTLSGQPKRQVRVARNAPARTVDLNGEYITGQCYVQYIRHHQPASDAPVMFWHGGAMTGVTWETTPDGRPGWHSYFLKQGFDTLVCDAMERGRSGWSPYPEIYKSEPIFRTRNEAWGQFRFGYADDYHADSRKRVAFRHQQFPVAHFDTLAKQFVPRWTDHAEQTLEAYYHALERTGPVWLIAHSQGGNLALEAVARQPQYFRGVVVIEPASAPATPGRGNQVPHLFVWGDNIEQSTVWTDYKLQVDNYVARLQNEDTPVTVLDLPAMGIRGNSHVPMMDLNSDPIAAMTVEWINDLSDNTRIKP